MLILRRQMRAFCSGVVSDGKAAIVAPAGVGKLSGLATLVPGVVVT
ncbi:hypothetical protein [Streptomyces sp. NPDC056390]